MTPLARPVPDRLLRRVLDPQLAHAIQAKGFRAAAVRGLATARAAGPHPARTGPAVVCRLYPVGDDAVLAFAQQGQLLVETTVFEDPDDVLAWNLKAGFENCLYVADQLLNARDQ